MVQYIVVTNSIDIIAGDCNYDLLKVMEIKLLDIFTDYVRGVNKPTQVSGSLIYYVYMIKVFMEELFLNPTAENIRFFQIIIL